MSITNLPTELLLEISLHLGFEDASPAHLAITCRRFYSVFIPAVLEDQVKHIAKLIAESQIMLYNDSRKQVTSSSFCRSDKPFQIPYRKLIYRVSWIDKNLRCVQGLIARSVYLQDIVLQLREPCSLQKLASIIAIACVARHDVCLTVSGISPNKEIGGPFTIQFRRTESLLIEDDEGENKPSAPTLFSRKAKSRLRSFPKRVLRLVSKFLNLSKGDPFSQLIPTTTILTPVHKPHAIPRKPEFNVVLPPRLLLSSFTINSETLFLPSLYPITLNILNTAPIKSLSLSHVNLNLFLWSQIFPAITMPSLTRLSIGKLSIAFPDLLGFLERHPSIEQLDFTGNDLIGTAKLHISPSPVNFLPWLSSLTASAEYVAPFLRLKSEEGYFPLLCHLHLRVSGDGGISDPSAELYPYTLPEHPNRPVFEILSRYNDQTDSDNNFSLSFDFLSTSGLIEWLLSSSSTSMDRLQDTTSSSSIHIPQLPAVRTLVISGSNSTTSPQLLIATNDVRRRLYRWISQYNPSLIKKHPSDYDSPFSKDHLIVERFIWFVCPRLQCIQLGVDPSHGHDGDKAGDRGTMLGQPSFVRLMRTI